jgi:wyosine [tRNA(Phe)-imidazoG37] synthetase (radical SAM superfamily)
MKYLFGPVSSRRFSMSLGIDLSPDEKSCNFDCIYCELEKAKKLDNIKNPPKVDDIIDEIKEAFKKYNFDVITITANGEPTLYPYLDELIDKLNLIKEDKKLLILSNSSTIFNEDIQNSLLKLDIVKLSLDSVIPNTFKKIDRQMEDIKIENIVDGIMKFSKKFQNELILEVLVVEGINDKIEEFQALNEVINKINPTRVDISTIDRPPAYDVKPVSYEKLFELSHEIKNQNIFIASRKNLHDKKENLNEEEILNTLSKRPFSKSDIENIFDKETQKIFNRLLEEKKIEIKFAGSVEFFKTRK